MGHVDYPDKEKLAKDLGVNVGELPDQGEFIDKQKGPSPYDNPSMPFDEKMKWFALMLDDRDVYLRYLADYIRSKALLHTI